MASSAPPDDEILVPNSMPSMPPDILRAATLRWPRANSIARSIETDLTLSELMTFGRLHLVDAVYDFELDRNHSLAQSKSNGWWRQTGVPFLAAIPKVVLRGIIQGTLAKDWYAGEPELAKLYGNAPSMSDSELSSEDEPMTAWMANGQITAPGHYVRFLVNSFGSPPSPNQLLQAANIMRQYVHRACDADLASTIDNVKGMRTASTEQEIQAGNFFFLCPDKSNRARAQTRVDKILAFCDSLEQRLLAVPERRRDEPDVRPLSYTGYSLVLSQRAREYEGSNSLFLMSFLGNIFQALKLDFQWKSFITSFCTSYDEARLGEILINGLAQSYHNTSYGVAVHPAGENCESARFSDKQYSKVEAWLENCILFRFNITPYEANVEEEIELEDRDAELQAAIELKRKQNRERHQRQIERDTPDIAGARAILARTVLNDDDNEVFPADVRAAYQLLQGYVEGELADIERIVASWADPACPGGPSSDV